MEKSNKVKMRNLETLIRLFEELPENACNMTSWLSLGRSSTLKQMRRKHFDCGAVACIGGWCKMLVAEKKEKHYMLVTSQEIRDFLGLDESEERWLFFDYPYEPTNDLTWKEWILIRLRHVRDTGEVINWEDVPGLVS